MINAERIANRVRRIRKDRGWNQTTLAERAGLSIGTIRKIESGKCPQQSLRVFDALKTALRVKLEFLVYGR